MRTNTRTHADQLWLLMSVLLPPAAEPRLCWREWQKKLQNGDCKLSTERNHPAATKERLGLSPAVCHLNRRSRWADQSRWSIILLFFLSNEVDLWNVVSWRFGCNPAATHPTYPPRVHLNYWTRDSFWQDLDLPLGVHRAFHLKKGLP